MYVCVNVCMCAIAHMCVFAHVFVCVCVCVVCTCVLLVQGLNVAHLNDIVHASNFVSVVYSVLGAAQGIYKLLQDRHMIG